MRQGSILQFAAHLAAVGAAMKAAERPALRAGATIIRDEARAVIGDYQAAAGPFAAWAPLADRTVREKTRLGYAPPDNPLLRTGKLRDSIGYSVAWTATQASAFIGSDAAQARRLEMGDNHVPPRSFIGLAAVTKGEEAAKAVARVFFAPLRG